MSQIKPVERVEENEISESSSSFKTLFIAVVTGLVFWSSLFALLFFALTS